MFYELRYSCFFFTLLLLGSCTIFGQKKENAKHPNKENNNDDLTIDSSYSTVGNISDGENIILDSIPLGSTSLNRDSLAANSSLRKTLDSLQNRLFFLEQDRNRLRTELVNLKKAMSYRIPGTKAMRITTNQSSYDCYLVNLKKTNLNFFWKNDQGEPLQNFNALENHLAKRGQQLIFAMNGGMYKPDQSPQGLYIQERKELRPIDRRKEEYGNFYMQPNGVFLIDTTNAASLVITEDFGDDESSKAIYATQSGPMAVIKGEINSKFNPDSKSKHIRNGVGIIDQYNVVFIISQRQVSLYDFASVFKDEFNCLNALYLDGAISRMYLPEIQRTQTLQGKFGPMIGIYK